jgi:DHA1 family bicyclomycin/chloramphenicol resistance-like MFS transporter
MTVTAAGIFATNMYVPSLPSIAADLVTTERMAQLTISVFLVVFAVFQLVYGPLADRYGRKRVMLSGLAIFMVANVVASTAQTIEWLLVARVLQAIGACAGMVITRAMVRDAYDRGESARIMAILGMGSGISSSIAPLLGGTLQGWTGDWRSSFVFMTVFTLVPMVVLAVSVRETLRRSTATRGGLGGMARDYLSLIRTPEYMLYALGAALMNATFFSFLAAAPFILVNVAGASPERLGAVLVYITGGFFVGTLVVSRIGSRFPLERLVLVGGIICFSGIAVQTLLGLGGARSESAIAIPMLLFGLGNGFVLPPTSVIAVSVRPQIAGTASALYGFNSFALGAVGTVVAGFLPHQSQLPLAFAMLAMTGTAVVFFVIGLVGAGRGWFRSPG